MARGFDGAASWLWFDSTGISTPALSISAWVYVVAAGASRRIVTIQNTVSGGVAILLDGDSGSFLHLYSRSTGGYGVTSAQRFKVARSTGQWYHVCGNANSSGDMIDAYLNGTAMTDQTGSVFSAATSGRLSVGAKTDGTSFANCRVAEIGLWTGAQLTAGEIAALAAAVSPRAIRPDSLAFYAPLIGRYSGEIDLVGGVTATHVSSPTTEDHPRIIYRHSRRPSKHSEAVGGGGAEAPAGQFNAVRLLTAYVPHTGTVVPRPVGVF